MASNEDAGFLSRWSRRKAEVREGRAAPVPVAEDKPAAAAPATPAVAPAAAAPAVAPQAAAEAPRQPPPPTMDDVAQLTRHSDYSRFVRPDVDSTVRNAAMKKLFADPHFNIMDGLDTYIDDYNKPDPLPASMLAKMVGAEFLGLVQKEPEAAPPVDAAASPPSPAGPAAGAIAPPDEDPDLRLQPDDAAGPGGTEPGAGQDPAGQH